MGFVGDQPAEVKGQRLLPGLSVGTGHLERPGSQTLGFLHPTGHPVRLAHAGVLSSVGVAEVGHPRLRECGLEDRDSVLVSPRQRVRVAQIGGDLGGPEVRSVARQLEPAFQQGDRARGRPLRYDPRKIAVRQRERLLDGLGQTKPLLTHAIASSNWPRSARLRRQRTVGRPRLATPSGRVAKRDDVLEFLDGVRVVARQ